LITEEGIEKDTFDLRQAQSPMPLRARIDPDIIIKLGANTANAKQV
jgi:hypothetical protein